MHGWIIKENSKRSEDTSVQLGWKFWRTQDSQARYSKRWLWRVWPEIWILYSPSLCSVSSAGKVYTLQSLELGRQLYDNRDLRDWKSSMSKRSDVIYSILQALEVNYSWFEIRREKCWMHCNTSVIIIKNIIGTEKSTDSMHCISKCITIGRKAWK